MVTTSGTLKFGRGLLDAAPGIPSAAVGTRNIYLFKGYMSAHLSTGLVSDNGGAPATPVPGVDITKSGSWLFTCSDLFSSSSANWLSTVRNVTGDVTKEAGSLRLHFDDVESSSPYTHVVTNNFGAMNIDVTNIDYQGSWTGTNLYFAPVYVDGYDGIYHYYGGQILDITLGADIIGVFKTGI